MFQMVKALVKIIFGCKICICQSVFNLFCGTVFSTFGIQKDDNIMFYWRRFRTRLCAQRQLPKDGARRVVFKSDHRNQMAVSLF